MNRLIYRLLSRHAAWRLECAENELRQARAQMEYELHLREQEVKRLESLAWKRKGQILSTYLPSRVWAAN